MERPAPYVSYPLGMERLPFETDGLRLSRGAAREVYDLTPLKGHEEELNSLLQEACGVTLPGTLGASFSDKFQLLWCRAGSYLLVTPEAFEIGVLQTLNRLAALRMVTDAWVALTLSGPRATEFFARQLVFDLDILPAETVVVSELFRQPVHIHRTEDGFDLRVARSLAGDFLRRFAAALDRFAAYEAFTRADPSDPEPGR